MHKFLIYFLLSGFFTLFSCSEQNIAISAEKAKLPFNEWKGILYKEAQKKGFETELLDNVFDLIKQSKSHITYDAKQFKKQSFAEYYNNAVNNLRIKKAKYRINKYDNILTSIENKYLVPKEYIVALWAVESDFGSGLGNYFVVNSLANLAYEGRREALFKKEFFVSLEILSSENISPKNFKGSWAGAIGQCQFLPSTCQNYAVDFNNDGKKDIWNDKEDVLASIANYLSALKWDIKLPWGYEITANVTLKELSNKQTYNLSSIIEKYGIKKLGKGNFTEYELKKNVEILNYDKRFFITFKNFDVIKTWNNSSYFALTIGLLANKIVGT